MTPATTGPTLAVVGATGSVGRVLLGLVSTRHDVWGEVRPVASRRSAGTAVKVRGEHVDVVELTAAAFDGVDVAVFCTPAEVSAHWAPPVAGRGAVVVDTSAAFREDPEVPVVAAEVNSGRLHERPRGIVAMPGSTTSGVVDVLAALHRVGGLTGLVLTCCHAASMTGRAGVERLYDELAVLGATRTLGQRGGDLRAALADALPGSTSPFTAPLVLNLVPFSGYDAADGWSSEEVAVRREVREVLGVADLAVSVTCVQVPVVTGHCVLVHALLQRPVTPAQARRAVVEAPGIVLLDDDGIDGVESPGGDGDVITPADVVGTDPAWVGRVRQAPDFPRTLDLVVCADNLRRGSALNAVRLAELLAEELRAAG